LDADSWILGGLLAGGLMAAAFSALAEAALASVSRLQLKQMLASGQTRAQAAEALSREPARYLAALLILKLLSFIIVSVAALLWTQQITASRTIVWTVLGSLLALVITQFVPRALVVGERENQIAVVIAPIVRSLALLLSPITSLMLRAGQSSVPNGEPVENLFLSEGGLRFLLNGSEEETIIEKEEKKMIASIFEFGETLVREVMVPRIDVVAINIETPMLEAADVILRGGHSRVPVYRESVDNVQGILYAKDLLRYLRDGRTDVPLGKILRPAYFIPESKKVDELLQELQHRRVHMAVVVDEYGGTAGIVTIEDLLEEIVGEIQDEYDVEHPTVEPVDENEYLFDARVPLDEVNELLKVELPTEGGDTLGGFIYSQLGKVPAVGDTIEYSGIAIEVLSVAGRRIKQVRTRRTQAVGEERSTTPA
jgi:putative hemolysin